jgi:biotin transport system substrate-specific component
VSSLDKLLWSAIGLLLTIGGVFIPAAIAVPMPLSELTQQKLPEALLNLPTIPLQVSFQIGAVLLVSCTGGKQAATISQIAYLFLGLSGYQVFAQGGGLHYLQEPTFGYLLGFVPAAWICGSLAFRQPPRLETLGLSSLIGLSAIHALGLVYLGGLALFRQLPEGLLTASWEYTVLPLPGQLAVICAVAVIARLLRLVLVY